MSFQALICPTCEEQPLESVKTLQGTIDRCPSCQFFLVDEATLAAYSNDRTQFYAALEETQSLLLASERRCPKCSQKLVQGRVRSLGLVLTSCTTCKALWTDFTELNRLDKVLERALRAQVEANAPAAPMGLETGGLKKDPLFARLLRGFAKTIQKSADRIANPSPDPFPYVSPLPKEKKASKKTAPKTPEAKTKEPKPVEEKKPPVEPLPAPEAKPERAPVETPAPRVPAEEPKPVVEEKPAAEPISIPEIKPDPMVEIPAPKAPAEEPKPVIEEKPAAEPMPVAKIKPEPAPFPKIKIDLPQPKSEPSGLSKITLAFKKAWNPTAYSAAPKVEKPKTPPKEKKPGVLSRLLASLKPKPKPPKPTAVLRPEPVPAPRKAAARPKVPWMDRMAGGLPWVLPILAVIINAFRGYDFDFGFTCLWAFAAWLAGKMVRLIRRYPFKSFEPTTVQMLEGISAATAWRGAPVELKGTIVIEGQAPKGQVNFQDQTGCVALDRFPSWDLIARLFGVADLAKLPKGDVTLKGWYRRRPGPFVEVSDVRIEKVSRKSLVRMLRWTFTLLLFFIAALILVTA